jgi:uncharacterized protein DUF6544
MLRLAFAVLILGHGLIHFTGFAKAFGFAKAEALKRPINRPAGLLWLLAGLGFIATAVSLGVAPERWWVAAIPALALSQILIIQAWSDARFGTIVNLIVLAPLTMAIVDRGGSSFRAIYEREVGSRIARAEPAPPIAEADLMPLPAPIRVYLERAGVVGTPHVHNFHARLHGGIRSRPNATFLSVRTEQMSFMYERARLFHLESSLMGIPIEALHLYIDESATMQVRVARTFDVVDARGPEMNRSETVTFFNDMCVFAPASLVDAQVEWAEIDRRSIKGTFKNAGNTISAVLSFDEEGDLVNFASDDRYQSSDGKAYKNIRWSTPIGDYRDFGGVRIASRGQGVWHEDYGEFVYLEIEVDAIEYNLEPSGSKIEATPPIALSRLDREPLR